MGSIFKIWSMRAGYLRFRKTLFLPAMLGGSEGGSRERRAILDAMRSVTKRSDPLMWDKQSQSHYPNNSSCFIGKRTCWVSLMLEGLLNDTGEEHHMIGRFWLMCWQGFQPGFHELSETDRYRAPDSLIFFLKQKKGYTTGFRVRLVFACFFFGCQVN